MVQKKQPRSVLRVVRLTMIELGSMDVFEYIQDDLNSEPRHNCESLAKAINDVSRELEFDSFRIMQLLLENKPIDALHTHSYGFHTSNGREIINAIQNKYYEYESAS
jgi:replication initiation and membrane attachment protein DnaB